MTQLRRVAIVGGNRIPFARSNTVYATASNQEMLTSALEGLVERYNQHGERLGEVVAGAVLKHSRDFNLTRECVLGSRLAPETPAYDIQQACGTGLEAAILVANKIALGHHQDDILETLLMNMIHQGAIGTMPPRLKMDKFDMEIIRPMCLVEEKDLTRIAVWRGYRKQIKNCPYESGSSRSDMKEVLSRLEAINPEARYSLWSSMSNIQEDYLPKIINHKS